MKRPRKPRRRCSRTKKVQFGSQQQAFNALLYRALTHHGEQRVYQCEFCDGWHLTAQTKKMA